MSTPRPESERRAFSRLQVLEYANISKPSENKPIRSIVVDVSLGGLQLRSKEQFKPGSQYWLVLGRNGRKQFRISAEARYCVAVEESDLFSTGFKCQPTNDAERIDWVDFVHDVFRESGETLLDD